MCLKTRSAEENRYVNKYHINKYHVDVSMSFETTWLDNFKEHLNNGSVSFHFTDHCKERNMERHIPIIPCERFIREGTCFEYKTIGDTLYRFAIRLAGKIKDYIAVFQPQICNGRLEMWVVTYYVNRKNDTHFTLRTWEYVN